MALSPSIPTSFVPKQPVAPSKRPRSSGNNIFFIVSLFIGILSIVAAGAVYLYAAYLTNVEKSKAAQVQTAENNVSPSTVEQFIRLRNRLSAADMVLNQHVELSQFFTLLESVTLQDVQFSDLKITVAEDRSAAIEMSGEAGNFNALAAESTAFASENDVKNAIFSGITVNQDGTVAFTLDATLDPSLVIEGAPPATPAALPAATGTSTEPTLPTTPSTTSPSTGSTTSP